VAFSRLTDNDEIERANITSDYLVLLKRNNKTNRMSPRELVESRKVGRTMAMPYIENEPFERDGWFESLIAKLRGKWAKTGHTGKRPSSRWACEIFNKCSTCNEHVSIACSLSGEANNIGLFLGKSWDAAEFSLFSQLYLIMLCEFIRNLEGISKTIEVDLPSPPKRVLIWGNSFAKHRLHILVQHHPAWIVADAYGDDWLAFKRQIPSSCLVDRCGVRHQIEPIDYDWLANRNHQKIF
jgi:hypothetical protein